MNRARTRGTTEANWEATQRLYAKLQSSGRCAEAVVIDPGGDDDAKWKEPSGVWFSLDDQSGKILIHDGLEMIGEWFAEREFRKRPFFKTPSATVAYDQSVNLTRMPAKEREQFWRHHGLLSRW